MYAIVEIAGQQFKVEKEQELFVHRLEGDAGSSVEFENVLLIDNGGKVTVGTPGVDGVKIKAKIVEHLKGDKVTVFHKKRRKGYQKENGHRQYLSKVLIEDILTGVKKSEKKEAVKEEPKKEVKAEVKTEKPKAAPKAKAESKEAPKKEEATKAEVKKEAKPIAAPKKEATKKEEPKVEKKEAKPKAAPKAEKPKEEKPKAAKKEENKEEK